MALTDVADDIGEINAAPDGGREADLVSAEAVRVVPADAAPGLPRLLVSVGWVRRRGLSTSGHGVVWRAPAPLTAEQRSALRAGRLADADAQVRGAVLGDRAPLPGPGVTFEDPGPSGTQTAGLVAGGVLVFALAVVAVTIALTRAESRDEGALLAAIGVPPATQRGVAGWQAVLVPAVGVTLGACLGLAGAWAALRVEPAWEDGPGRVELPWAGLALLAAVPLVGGLVTRVGATLAWRHRRCERV